MTLPVLLSIPHGGFRVPEELRDRVCLQKADLLDDSDAYTLDIYDLGPKVVEVIRMEIARAIVDLNRAPDDRPPQNPDGVVKSVTCYGRPIYNPGREPDEDLTARILTRYYEPYHQRIRQSLERPGIELALDCHSMAAIGPHISPDQGQERPMICLGDVHGQACPPEMVRRLADCFRHAFSLKETDVTINRPFAGGYITRTYGGRPRPWIQVEMSRALYLEPRWFDRPSLTIDRSRLRALNRMFEAALRGFFA